MDPDDPTYYVFSIAYYYGAEGRPAHAVSYLDGAIAQYGKKPLLLAGRCWQRAALGAQLELAREDCDAAISMKVGEAYPESARCFVNLKLGDYKAAIKDCDAGLADSPRYAGALLCAVSQS